MVFASANISPKCREYENAASARGIRVPYYVHILHTHTHGYCAWREHVVGLVGKPCRDKKRVLNIFLRFFQAPACLRWPLMNSAIPWDWRTVRSKVLSCILGIKDWVRTMSCRRTTGMGFSKCTVSTLFRNINIIISDFIENLRRLNVPRIIGALQMQLLFWLRAYYSASLSSFFFWLQFKFVQSKIK